MISNLSQRSSRYLEEHQTKEERHATRGKHASNNSRRRRHKSRRLLPQPALPPALDGVTPTELELAADGAAQAEEEQS